MCLILLRLTRADPAISMRDQPVVALREQRALMRPHSMRPHSMRPRSLAAPRQWEGREPMLAQSSALRLRPQPLVDLVSHYATRVTNAGDPSGARISFVIATRVARRERRRGAARSPRRSPRRCGRQRRLERSSRSFRPSHAEIVHIPETRARTVAAGPDARIRGDRRASPGGSRRPARR